MRAFLERAPWKRVALLIALNFAAATAIARSARAAYLRQPGSCFDPGVCHCIIVDPHFGYCSEQGDDFMPGCMFQTDCMPGGS